MEATSEGQGAGEGEQEAGQEEVAAGGDRQVCTDMTAPWLL